MAPFRGYSPKIFAACVLVTSTNCCSVMRFFATPYVYMSAMRFSMPAAPFGIFRKSSFPAIF